MCLLLRINDPLPFLVNTKHRRIEADKGSDGLLFVHCDERSLMTKLSKPQSCKCATASSALNHPLRTPTSVAAISLLARLMRACAWRRWPMTKLVKPDDVATDDV